MATTNAHTKGKKKAKAFIENMPDIPEHEDKTHSIPYYVAPMDTINLNDDSDDAVLAVMTGTDAAPIYVSDYEDCSDVAIKGERKPKSGVAASTHAASATTDMALPSLREDSSDDSTDDSTPPLFDDLLAPPGQARKSPPRKPRRKKESKSASTPVSKSSSGKKKTNNLGANPGQYLNSPATPVSKDSSAAVKSAATSVKTTKAKNLAQKFKSPFGKNKKKVQPYSDDPNKAVHIDVTALADEDEDPVLERELEEIALHGGRSGLISGTPGAYDVEHGRGRRFFGNKKSNPTKIKYAHKPGYREDPSVTYVDEEDELDKSWHGNLARHNRSSKWTRKKMLWTALELGLVVLMISLLAAFVAKRNSAPQPGDPLTPEQQVIHDAIVRVTGPKILEDPTTPQHIARRWLLYEDDEVWNASEEGVIQRYALASFYFATGGGDRRWVENSWMIGPECGNNDREPWTGLNCSPDGEVRALVLDAWGLTGTIPPELGHLYKLENLILKNHAHLEGWIPATFGHLARLRQLGLYNNNLSGVLPNIFEHTKALEFINLERNNIHGSIPLEIHHLTNLETLVLKKNRFEGIVPFEQLASTSIRYLGLSYNRFSSKLERAMKEMTALEYVYLDHNELRGPLPDHIGELTNLKSIDLGNNHFTGVIPSEIGNLRRLEYLSVNDNDFKGRIPREIGLLNNLRSLNAASNQLTGTLPNIANMVNLKNLHLFENSLTGSIPESLLQLQSIEILFLSSNKLSGSIPKEISLLSRTMRGLYLSDNDFTGSIPTQMCIFSSLEALFLDTNKIDGQIPNCFGQLTALRQLYLFQNQLIGTVPNNLQNLRQLTGLGLESNNFVGEVTDDVCGLVNEKAIDVWADCADQSGQDSLICSCCSVCCPSDQCV